MATLMTDVDGNPGDMVFLGCQELPQDKLWEGATGYRELLILPGGEGGSLAERPWNSSSVLYSPWPSLTNIPKPQVLSQQ